MNVSKGHREPALGPSELSMTELAFSNSTMLLIFSQLKIKMTFQKHICTLLIRTNCKKISEKIVKKNIVEKLCKVPFNR